MAVPLNRGHYDTTLVPALLVLFRVLCVPLVRTAFVPDEYWQGPEIAQRLVWGYGFWTWEWAEGIRSALHPTFLAIPLFFLKALGVTTPEVYIVAPRVLQGVSLEVLARGKTGLARAETDLRLSLGHSICIWSSRMATV